jgi:hypothetical protein
VTQGILVGTGNGLLQYTLPAILPEYFSKHSGLVQGIAAAGKLTPCLVICVELT